MSLGSFFKKLFGKEPTTKEQSQAEDAKKIQNFFDGITNAYFEQAKKGNAEAQYTVGCFYCNGTNVEQNYSEAVKWFSKAAEQNYPDAVFNLGVCYYQGKGVEEDNKKAYDLFIKAQNLGYKLPPGLLADVGRHLLLGK